MSLPSAPSLSPAIQLRICLLAIAVFLGLLQSCTPQKETLSLPADIGQWKRSAQIPLDPTSFPDALRRLNAMRGVRASYRSADTEVQATVYEMPSATSAFEAVQTFPRQADEYYFQKGASFVVLGLGQLVVEARRPFLLEFQKATSPDGADPKKE
ncbi:MAG: hypothetical protein U5J83_17075 [Bryobacterales bacterium]|nr:hypothetical protein [Bryobacterales bacterium]